MSSGFCTLQWESKDELWSVQGLVDGIRFVVVKCQGEIRSGREWLSKTFERIELTGVPFFLF